MDDTEMPQATDKTNLHKEKTMKRILRALVIVAMMFAVPCGAMWFLTANMTSEFFSENFMTAMKIISLLIFVLVVMVIWVVWKEIKRC